MRLPIRTLVLSMAVVLACATVRVETDHDPTVDFDGYRSYAWLHSTLPATGDPRLDNPLLHGRLIEAVDRALAAKGYELREGAEVDFYVGYHLSTRTRLDVARMNQYYGYGGGRWGPMGVPETVVHEYEEGALVIDIADARLERLAWRGSGRARLRETQPTPEESQARIQAAVSEILDHFPPQ